MTLNEAFCRAALASAVLSRAKMSARKQSIEAIRKLEARLVEVLGGENLRGLPNISPNGGQFYGLRVGAQARHNASAVLPTDGREVLMITPSGRLVAAKVQGRQVAQRKITDDELMLEDLELFAHVVREALEKHIALSDGRVNKLARAEDLARRITEAIGEPR